MIAVGVLLKAAAAGWLGLSVKMEIRPLEAITLAVNLLIALFLQRFFATRMTDMRAEKNVLIASAQEILRALSNLRDHTNAIQNKASLSEKDKFAVLQEARRLSNAITEMQDCIAISSFGSMMEHVPGLWNDYYTLKQRATAAHSQPRDLHSRNKARWNAFSDYLERTVED